MTAAPGRAAGTDATGCALCTGPAAPARSAPVTLDGATVALVVPPTDGRRPGPRRGRCDGARCWPGHRRAREPHRSATPAGCPGPAGNVRAWDLFYRAADPTRAGIAMPDRPPSPQRHHHRLRPGRLHRRGVRRPRQPRAARVRGGRHRRWRADEHHRGRELPRLPRRHPGPGADGRDAGPGRAVRRRAGRRRRHRGRPDRRGQGRHDRGGHLHRAAR